MKRKRSVRCFGKNVERLEGMERIWKMGKETSEG